MKIKVKSQNCTVKQFVKICLLLAGMGGPFFLASNDWVYAAPAGLDQETYTEINLSFPKDNRSLEMRITTPQATAYGWHAGQKIRVKVYVERVSGRKEFIKDVRGNASWEVVLNSEKEGSISFIPNQENFTGRIVMSANGEALSGSQDSVGGRANPVIEKVYEYRFDDGAKIKVHYTDQVLEQSQEEVYFPKDVLDAAVLAYQTITQFKGFSSPGYSFVSPDKNYVHDPDQTIDVYLGSPNEQPPLQNHGFSSLSFKDAPCFDTIKESPREAQAVILLPANYKQFIKSWERINPSPLGIRNVNVDLRGTLMHEMLHVVLFYYNKNLNKETQIREETSAPKVASKLKKIDWYVEGLARYFETFAGAKHDFFSQGFKETFPDKIRFSRGGSNYFMRYPDQAFVDLRYENALFWRFMDYRYGMPTIEKLSRVFREGGQENFKEALEAVTHVPFEGLLKKFSLSILFKDFGLKEDSAYLRDIAKTRLVYRDGNLYLKDGFGGEKFLGKGCATDWIGEWESARAHLNEAAVAGDNTSQSDVSGWATDFYQVDLAGDSPTLPWLGVSHDKGGQFLMVQVILVSKGGSYIFKEIGPISKHENRGMDLREIVKKEGLRSMDIEKIYLLITNTDPKETAEYQIVTRP